MGYPKIELLVFGDIGGRFLVRSYTPGLDRVSRISPNPLISAKQLLVFLISTRVDEGCGVMGAAAVTNDIVNDTKVGEHDELRERLAINYKTIMQ